MTAGLGDGRFGPAYIGLDPETDRVVVIRTFTAPMTAEQQQVLVSALQRLCTSPLDHVSIARPLAAGVEDGLPFLAHDYLPGSSVDEYLQAHGPRPLAEVTRRVTQLASALDFAAAAGIHHGALGPRDILFGLDSTGVSGFGLTQAAREAGLESTDPTLADDVYALGAMTFELLLGYRYDGGDLQEPLASLASPGVNIDTLTRAMSAALSPDPDDWPATALQFASALQSAVVTPPPAARADAGTRPANVGRLEFELREFDAEEAPPPVVEPAEPERAQPIDPARPTVAAVAAVPAARPPEFPPDTTERPELPLFDLSLHHQPQQPQAPAPAFRHVPAAPTFGSATYVEQERSSSRGLLVAALLAFLIIGGIAAYLFLLRDGSAGRSDTQAAAALDPGDDSAAPPDPPPPDAEPPAPQNGSDGGVEPQEQPRAVPPSEPVAPPAPVVQDPPVRVPGSANQGTPPASPRPSGAVPGATPAPVPAAPATPPGRLLVRSIPSGARVMVDGQPRGETPVAIRGLELGAHTVTVTAAGFPAWEQQVMLTTERPSQSFEIPLDGSAIAPAVQGSAAAAPPVAASLHIESRPSGAQVWVNGALLGTTPFTLPGVAAGQHMLRIELTGYRPWTTSVTVGRGERLRVAASLER